MKEIKVALYKWKKTFFSKLISWKQSFSYAKRYSDYTHVELVFDNDHSFSSSEVDEWVRFKIIKFKKKNWDFITIPVSNHHYHEIKSFCYSQEWNEYNWWWIFFAQIFNMNFKWKNTWFCSEICSRAIQEAKLLCPESSLFINPARLACLLEEEWFNIKR